MYPLHGSHGAVHELYQRKWFINYRVWSLFGFSGYLVGFAVNRFASSLASIGFNESNGC